MIRKLIKIVGTALVVLVLIAAIGIGVVSWRLYRGPIDADFAVRYVQQGLSQSSKDVAIKLGKTQIVWAESGGVRLRSQNLTIFDTNGKMIAKFPQVAVGVSPGALLLGKIRIETIRLQRPQITLQREPRGGIKLNDDASGGEDRGQGRFLSTLFDQLAEAPDDDGVISALRNIEIVGARVTLTDPTIKQVWRAGKLHAVFSRGTRGIAGKLSFDLQVGDQSVRFAADALYRKSTGDISATLAFNGLSPSVFATARGPLEALANLRMPLTGKISFEGNESGAIKSGTVDVEGGEGWIEAPGVYAAPLRVKAVLVSVDLKDGGRVGMLNRFWVDLGESTLALNGVVKGQDGKFSFDGGASMTQFAVQSLSQLWPALVSRNGKLWVAENIAGGRVPYLDVNFKLDIDTRREEVVRLSRLAGTFDFKNLSVRYFGSLPPVRNVDGTGVFGPTELKFTLSKGRVSRSKVTDATVRIYDLEAPVQKISIDSRIDGRMDDILRIVDRKPLGFAKKMGVNPAVIGGNAKVRVTTAFPLIKNLTFKEVKITADAQIRDLTWRKALFGLDLTAGRFRLKVGKDGFSMDGNTLLAGSKSTMTWKEKFGPKTNAWRRQLALKGAFTPQALLQAGVDLRWFMTGPFGADLKVNAFDDGRTVIDGRYDFRRSRITVPVLNTVKPVGMAATGQSVLVIKGVRLESVSRFNLTSPVVSASGSATFMPDGKTLRRLTLNRLVSGRTNLSATIESRGRAGRRIALKGASFDLVPVLKGSPDKSKAQEPPQPLTITANVGKLFVTKGLAFQSVTGTARHDGKAFQSVRMKAQLPSRKSLNLSLSPGKNGQVISLTSDDGGGALEALGLVDVLRDGKLTIRALRRPAAKGKPMRGTVKLEGFRIVRAPAIARFFAAAERRRVDKSIAMQRLELGFLLKDGRFYIRGGQAYSAQIGVTASGQIDRKKGTVRLRGTFVPLYALNSVFGKIPLFGRLLVGEKGSGLFAAHFTVNGDLKKPRFNVNPISILTPGVIRRIFDIGSGVSDPDLKQGPRLPKSRGIRPRGPDR